MQFAPTPKFSIPKPVQRPEADKHRPSPTVATGGLKKALIQSSGESIEDSSPHVEEPGEDPVFQLGDASEEEMLFDICELRDQQDISSFRVPKRPRLVPPENAHEEAHESSACARPTSSSSHLATTTPHRFLLRPAHHSSASTPFAESPAPARPSFLTPQISEESALADPLPHEFSPHRRSEKFLPSGMAATMRAHIVETTATHSHSSSRWSGGWRIRVTACSSASGKGMTMIQGVTDSGLRENVMLVGKGESPSPDDSIVIKGVSWGIDVDHQRWIVGIEWRVEK
jgi:hypothetical protein